MTEERLSKIESNWKSVGIQDWDNTGRFVISEIRRLKEENERLQERINSWHHMQLTSSVILRQQAMIDDLAEALRKIKYMPGGASIKKMAYEVLRKHGLEEGK